uniref:response regulator n=1 Tax=Aliarcobacter sp. TaxID=2321116 RepID=UPI004048A443
MKKFSILIVDDIETNIYSLKLIIEQNFDVEIYSALNANKALEILLNNDIELILSDVQMPDIDGFHFVEYIKNIEKTKYIPVIFITGIYNKDEYQKKGYNLGAIEYISKPIDEILLISKLKIYIDLFEEKKKDKLEINRKDEILIHQSKMATIGEMVGVISHQLKQPLNNLSLYCADVKDSFTYNEINQEFVDDFYINTKKQISFMTETIDGFINFFSPTKEKKLFQIKDAINKTIKLLDKQLINKNIVINLNIGDEAAYGIETELEQIFLNLITNTKQAFDEKDIKEKEINITTLEKDNNSIILFEDTAGGVDKENIDKLFDPYFTTKVNGTGTGLYMVQLIVKSSFNGDIKIQNTQRGLRFMIILPKNTNQKI